MMASHCKLNTIENPFSKHEMKWYYECELMVSAFLLSIWQALIPSFEKTEFQESRNSIIHFDVERQTKSQLKKNKKQSVEMINIISFSKSQEYSSWNDNGACRITSNKQYENTFINKICTFNMNKISFTQTLCITRKTSIKKS